jgi:hypothetical protein
VPRRYAQAARPGGDGRSHIAERVMAIASELYSWLVDAIRWYFAAEVGTIAATGMASLVVAHVVRK